MRPDRRRALLLGAGAAALTLPAWPLLAAPAVEIAMAGSENGARVWFDPAGLLVDRGQTLRWVNRDPRNAHTATAYHPANGDRPRRIPAGAEPWDSGYLLPGETFSVTLTVPGVYDYFCVPHEAAGMVGRIVVAGPSGPGAAAPAADGDLPQAAIEAFPPLDLILEQGTIAGGNGSGGGDH